MPLLNRTGRKEGTKRKPKMELGAEDVQSEIKQMIQEAKARDKGKVALPVNRNTIVLVSPEKATADYQHKFNAKYSRP